jgi:RimJ/RimL family protein N-acetyltransferase
MAAVRLRPFKQGDAKYLIDWVKEEQTFAMWCANKFTYPLTEEQLIEYKELYENNEQGWLFTALDENGKPIGHLLMRNANYSNLSVHFGFVIIDQNLRGRGYGKEMIRLAVKYAFEILKVKKVTLGVFANNPAAHNCYKSVGFVDQKFYEDFFPFKDEKWGLYDMLVRDEG